MASGRKIIEVADTALEFTRLGSGEAKAGMFHGTFAEAGAGEHPMSKVGWAESHTEDEQQLRRRRRTWQSTRCMGS